MGFGDVAVACRMLVLPEQECSGLVCAVCQQRTQGTRLGLQQKRELSSLL